MRSPTPSRRTVSPPSGCASPSPDENEIDVFTPLAPTIRVVSTPPTVPSRGLRALPRPDAPCRAMSDAIACAAEDARCRQTAGALAGFTSWQIWSLVSWPVASTILSASSIRSRGQLVRADLVRRGSYSGGLQPLEYQAPRVQIPMSALTGVEMFQRVAIATSRVYPPVQPATMRREGRSRGTP